MAKVKVLYFARAREVSGKPEEHISLEGECSVQWLATVLEAKYEDMAGLLKSGTLALNETYVENYDGQILKDGDTVAVIPPISGG